MTTACMTTAFLHCCNNVCKSKNLSPLIEAFSLHLVYSGLRISAKQSMAFLLIFYPFLVFVDINSKRRKVLQHSTRILLVFIIVQIKLFCWYFIVLFQLRCLIHYHHKFFQFLFTAGDKWIGSDGCWRGGRKKQGQHL